MNLAATSSHRSQSESRRSHPTLLNNHFDNETPIKPLFNSSPLNAANQRNAFRTGSNVGDEVEEETIPQIL